MLPLHDNASSMAHEMGQYVFHKISTIRSKFNTHCPSSLTPSQKRKKLFNLRKPSFTKGLAKSVKKKNMLYKGFLNNPNSSNKNANKSYKNKLAHSL